MRCILLLGVLVLAGCGGGVAGTPGATGGKASADPRRLAQHSWWRGKVDVANLDRLLAEMQAHDSVTIVANQAGQFVAVPEKNEHGARAGRDSVITFDFVYRKRPEIAALGAPRMYVFIRLRIGQRLTQAEAERLLEDSLTEFTTGDAAH